MAGSYTIIQPRVSPSLPSANVSSFSRLFAIYPHRPLTKAVSDVYQDLAGEGSYHGKGIYDVRAFSQCCREGFLKRDAKPRSDEGAHVRVGLASDIELFDEFPQEYPSYISGQHRWIRGDWQIADWVFAVRLQRNPAAGALPNPLCAV